MGESRNPPRLPMHQVLGGGSVADILLWRNWGGSILVLVSATSLWLLFERGDYNLLSFTANVLLFLVVVLFLWAKSASILNRPLPPVPDLEIADSSVDKAAEVLCVWINHALSFARQTVVDNNLKILPQVVIALCLISYVGSLCDFLTLLYVGVLLSLAIAPLYEKYQHPLDMNLDKVQRTVQGQFGLAPAKMKKSQ